MGEETGRCQALTQSLGPPPSPQARQSKDRVGVSEPPSLPGCAVLSVWEPGWGRCSAGLGAPGREPGGGYYGIFHSSLLKVVLILPRVREKPCRAIACSSANSLPSRQRGFCSLWDTLDPQPSCPWLWLCPSSPKERGGSEGSALPSQPWAAPVLLHGAGMVSPGSAAACSTHAAPNTLVGLFPSSVGLCWKPNCPTAFCREGDPWPAAAGTRGWAPVGPCCEALGSAMGLFSGLLRRASSYDSAYPVDV